MNVETGDIVLVNSFAGPKVWVKLQKRIVKPPDFWGANGWEAKIIYKRDVDKLRAAGVPYKKNENPVVFVFDWHIIKKRKRQSRV